MSAAELEISQAGTVRSEEQSYAVGSSPAVMTKIYQSQINLVVLQRSLDKEVSDYCQTLIESQPSYNLRIVINPEKAALSLRSLLPDLNNQSAFIDDLVLILEMYACLFELDEVGLRLQVLDRAMCPRFHTDKLGCRLVSTFVGPGTEWLHNRDVDRSKLGTGNMGLSDNESGLFSRTECIQQVNSGDIVLLKGDGWYDNDGLGVVHRSPAITGGEKRVIVTMDFA